MEMSIGIEGTFAPQSGKDTLSLTGHYELPQRDFKLIRELGVQHFRYPIPWHRIERQPGSYDWGFLDRVLPSIQDDFGLTIIADPLHHTSYPAWLHRGFLDDRFVEHYTRFVEVFAERYPMVQSYTPFNEPTCTLDFCGFRGFWHPYGTADWLFVWMLEHTARAYAEVVHMLRAKNSQTQILHVDTFEHHAPLDEASLARAHFLNERRFLFEELVLGKVTPTHSLYDYLVNHGFSARGLDWHQGHPIQIDERGGNYYPLNEEQLRGGRTFHAPSHNPRGFAQVAGDYAARLAQPLSLTETNIQGSVSDRITWLKYMVEQAELLGQHGIPLRQFAWYPLFDCAGWHCLLQGDNWPRDPQGIFPCDANWNRLPTELSSYYQRLAKGGRARELPAYTFRQAHTETLRGLIPQMSWKWESPPQELCGL
jgi:hypothetical protein